MMMNNISDAYIKGNLFEDLYRPYKNYTPKKPTFKSDEDKMLWDLNEKSFAMHELNLYLDLHPDDISMIELFNDYRKEFIKITEEYEQKYGPLNITSNALSASPFLWEEIDFPFGGNDNVEI